MAEKKNIFTIYSDSEHGSAQISDEVLANIAGLAATEIEGVHSLGGNITGDKIGRIRRKTIFRGVQVDVLENVVSVRVIINMKYGYNIPSTTRKVQDRVKTTLENMTGLSVADVNVSVAAVAVATPC